MHARGSRVGGRGGWIFNPGAVMKFEVKKESLLSGNTVWEPKAAFSLTVRIDTQSVT